MNVKSERDAQEIGEQELEQVVGAGANDSFQCTCGCTEYDLKYERNPLGTRCHKECKNCHKKYK